MSEALPKHVVTAIGRQTYYLIQQIIRTKDELSNRLFTCFDELIQTSLFRIWVTSKGDNLALNGKIHSWKMNKYSKYYESVVLPEKLFKVIIIGDPTVGKTSFVQRYVENTYRKDYKGTVGVDFALKVLKWSESQTVKLQLWDIAGQERFTWMTRVYYKDAHGCVIMFDLTNKNSFVNSLKWKKDVDSKCSLPDGRPLPCMLLANKCDLSHRQIDQAEIEAFHKEHNFCGWTETSAKEGVMVNDSMRFLIEVMMRQENLLNTTAYYEDNFKLSGPVTKNNKKCSC